MLKSRYFCGGSVLAATIAIGLIPAAADAQVGAASNHPAAPPPTPSEVSEVVVTGSFIAGTPETAALPVDVVGAQELAKRGSPSMVQFIKTIPSSGAVVGENNRFGGGNGVATVNLRNLNASIGSVTGTRTLVLFNGRRVATNVRSGYAVDVNSFPTAAIGRVEVLKDGAAATYGSDAIAGVVNFITRTNLDGFEVSGQYQAIKGSDGDYEGNLSWGKIGDWGNILLTGGYRRRSELPVQERSWALRTGVAGYLQNPLGGWAATGNPGAYLYSATAPTGSPSTGYTSANFASAFEDIGCAANGGAPYALGSATFSTGSCNFQYTTFDNLVENENHYTLYGELNFHITDETSFHAEALWNRNQTPNQSWAMTGPNQYPAPELASGSSPGGGVSPIPATGTSEQSRFYIPNTNPGLLALVQQVNAASCAGGGTLPFGVDATSCAAGLTAARNGATAASLYGLVASPTAWRPVGFAGNPYTSDNHSHYSYNTDTWRIEGGFKGKIFNDIGWDLSATYQDIDYHYNLQDVAVNRLQLGLRGYGSRAGNADQCTAAETANFTTNAGNAALGCYYFNPFTNAFPQSLSNVPANPYYIGSSTIPGFNEANTNRADVVNWMEDEQYNTNTTRMFVVDGILNGDTGWHLWAKDSVRWAAGGQFRYDRYVQNPDAAYDAYSTPCVDSPPYGDGSPFCPTTGNGPFLFNANLRPYDLDRKIVAGFGEIRIPVTDDLEVTVAGRYEKYLHLGDTFNPKINARWQALEWLAFRGSASTTYRAPLPTWASSTYFQRALTNATGTYRANDLSGNSNLKPETADTYSVGFIVQQGPFTATLDYWKYKFKKQITTESTTDLLNVARAGCASGVDPAIAARFTTDGALCSGGVLNTAGILSFRTRYINGGDIMTDGLDAQVNLTFDDVIGGGRLSAGVDGSYLLHYRESPYEIEGHATSTGDVERAGTYRSSLFIGYNKIRANAFLNYSLGRHNLRWQTRWISSTTIASTETTALAIAAAVHGNTKVPEYFQHDLTYTAELPWDSVLTLSVQNLFDKDPPFAFATQYNYDPSSGSPLGRVFVIGLKKSF
jgi:iron complex outermembrane receptor protein